MSTTFAKFDRVTSEGMTGTVTDVTTIGDLQHVSITWEADANHDYETQTWYTAGMLDSLGVVAVRETPRELVRREAREHGWSQWQGNEDSMHDMFVHGRAVVSIWWTARDTSTGSALVTDDSRTDSRPRMAIVDARTWLSASEVSA